jgi:hypothetical protein
LLEINFIPFFLFLSLSLSLTLSPLSLSSLSLSLSSLPLPLPLPFPLPPLPLPSVFLSYHSFLCCLERVVHILFLAHFLKPLSDILSNLSLIFTSSAPQLGIIIKD